VTARLRNGSFCSKADGRARGVAYAPTHALQHCHEQAYQGLCGVQVQRAAATLHCKAAEKVDSRADIGGAGDAKHCEAPENVTPAPQLRGSGRFVEAKAQRAQGCAVPPLQLPQGRHSGGQL
jgi:hypothetical protein